MSISGNIGTMPFADLLQWIAASRKTGTLVVEGETETKKVYFNQGQVTAAASENPREFLGYYLVGWGYLDEEELRHALQMQESHGALLGELLVVVGQLTQEEMDELLRVKTEEAVYSLFLWDTGAFRFLDNILPAKKFRPLAIPVDLLVLEGARRRDEWARIREVVPDPSRVPRLHAAVDMSTVDSLGRDILRELDGHTTIENIALACRTSVFYVMEFVYHGVTGHWLELADSGESETEIPGYSRTAWRVEIGKAESALRNGDLLAAYERAVAVREGHGDVRTAAERATGVIDGVVRALDQRGLNDNTVPVLEMSHDELTSVDCRPEEGFLLSRVNGRYSVGEILKLIPGDAVKNKLMLWSLIDRGLLRMVPGITT